jgi:PAS domain S-box-containing protein
MARLPQLSGVAFGRYRLLEQVGEGTVGAVYVAVADGQSQQPVAIKVLDPGFVDRQGFTHRFEADVRLVSSIGHPTVLPIQEYGVSNGYTFLVMPLAAGTLHQALQGGPLEPGRAWRVLKSLGDALHHAHERGVVHYDVKPSNVLFDSGGNVLLADFGIARISYGFVGTPGYMAPEQALGRLSDRRADVHALAVLAFEMLTGSRPYAADAPTDLILATVRSPVPSAVARRPELPAELDAVLSKGLAKDPEERHPTVLHLLRDLAEVPIGRPRPAAARSLPPATRPPEDHGLAPMPSAPPSQPQAEIDAGAFKGRFAPVDLPAEELDARDSEEAFERAEARLMTVFNNALSAAVAVDGSSFIVGWNATAEQTFGWPAEAIIGRSLSSTIIPPQYREAHERGFTKYLQTGEGPVLGKRIEISAMHRDGHEFPIELSISPAARSRTRALFVAFIRDLTKEKRAQQVTEAVAAVAEALKGGRRVEASGLHVLQAIAGKLEWKAAALWTRDPAPSNRLRCRQFWKAADFQCYAFEKATREAALARGDDLPGRVWATGEPTWVADVLSEELPRTLPALRAGLHTGIAFPLLDLGEVVGVIELFHDVPQSEDDELLTRLYGVGRRIGGHFGKGERNDVALHPDAS